MQAFLITAYTDKEYLAKLISYLQCMGRVYVHVDLKSDININDIELSEGTDVVIIKKFNTSWGSSRHLEAIIHMINYILQDETITYIHILSGQDIPIKKKEYFDNIANSKDIYMSCDSLDNVPIRTRERYVYRHFFTQINGRNKIYKAFDRFTTFIQRVFCTEQNKIGENKIYKGMVWISAPSETLRYALNYVNVNAQFKKRLKQVLLPEEIFFQTILMNSEYHRYVKHNLHYTDWSYRNESIPAYLDESDIEKIVNSECGFARKVSSSVSRKLINYVETCILKE